MINYAVCVTSLPRTGTVSICEMLEVLGFKTYHAPLSSIHEKLDNKVAFADTPAYAPSVINNIKESSTNVKFIYIDRDFDTWFESMTKSTNLLRTAHRFIQTPDKDLSYGQLEDKKFYYEIFGKYDMTSQSFKQVIKTRFNEHRETVKDHGLVYKFSDGWKPLCEFLGLNIPENKNIPHKHKGHIGT